MCGQDHYDTLSDECTNSTSVNTFSHLVPYIGTKILNFAATSPRVAFGVFDFNLWIFNLCVTDPRGGGGFANDSSRVSENNEII